MTRSSSLHTSAPSSSPARGFAELEQRFVDNWAGLARSFGMDPTLGRVHALTFVRHAGVDAEATADALGLSAPEATRYLEELASWGVVRRDTGDGTERLYLADGDPWSWFLVTLKERGRREFGPLLRAIRETHDNAQALRGSLHSTEQSEHKSLERIARFTLFVEQIAGLLETFAQLGAGPVMSALRMAAKLRGPRLLRV
jgi:DNA-binding transcriptional regulator GbsR (MarR family)